ncbi:MAG: hypothetical protein MZV70_15735 [Desulfobacterales bacterium]|nr:hypothetical protein [Desulfobacterales bacterium]
MMSLTFLCSTSGTFAAAGAGAAGRLTRRQAARAAPKLGAADFAWGFRPALHGAWRGRGGRAGGRRRRGRGFCGRGEHRCGGRLWKRDRGDRGSRRLLSRRRHVGGCRRRRPAHQTYAPAAADRAPRRRSTRRQ